LSFRTRSAALRAELDAESISLESGFPLPDQVEDKFRGNDKAQFATRCEHWPIIFDGGISAVNSVVVSAPVTLDKLPPTFLIEHTARRLWDPSSQNRPLCRRRATGPHNFDFQVKDRSD